MDIRITCDKCGTAYKAPAEKIQERVVRIACKRCGQEITLSRGSGGIEARGASLKSPFHIAIPKQVGKYHDLKLLASGGMGDIYLAKMGGVEGFEREVVLKMLHPHLARDANFAGAMVDEAKLTVLLHHPNIVQMYDLERIGDLLYSVIEYVPGKSLALIQRTYRMKGGFISLPMAVYIAGEALEGLGYAHGLRDGLGHPLGIVHRDISPQNIMVSKEGWVKIIDFGIAKAATSISQTSPGMVKGKFAYMAPEQFKGTADHRADLFSLGVVLWETLTGLRLFSSSTEVETLNKVLNFEPPSVHAIRPEVPPEMDRVLRRVLDKDIDKRYGTAGEFKSDLLAVVAPSTLEQLKASVDIDADCLGEGHPQSLKEGDLFSEVTPSANVKDVFEAKTKVAVVEVIEQAGPPSAMARLWIGLAAILLLGVGIALAVAFWPQGPGAPDAGAALPPLPAPIPDGGNATEAAPVIDAGPLVPAPADPEPADAGAAAEPLSADGKTIAQVGTPVHHPPAPVHLTGKMIEKFLVRHGGAFQRCADQFLSKEGSGKDVALTLDLTIAGDGRVAKAGLNPNSFESLDFGRCLLRVAQRLEFPRQQDLSVSISFPLEFQAVKK